MTDMYLEVGGKKTIAWSLEWPGWCRIRTSEDTAIQALIETEGRYRASPSPLLAAALHFTAFPPTEAEGCGIELDACSLIGGVPTSGKDQLCLALQRIAMAPDQEV